MKRGRLTALLLAVALLAHPAEAAKRIGLVIGNDAYVNVEPLDKAVNDARGIADALQAVGFTIILAQDVDRRAFNQRLQEFASAIAPGDEAFFFFAGHGVEIDGRNFLLPVDIPSARQGEEELIKGEAIAVDRVLEIVRDRRPRIDILVLDACRQNPFKRPGTRGLGGTRGLAATVAPEGTFIMYSAGVGQTALDRLGDDDPHPNSVFTRSLLPLLGEPGLLLPELARRVRAEVLALAGTVGHDQRPAYYDEIVGPFSFRPAAALTDPSAPAAPDAEAVLWGQIEGSSLSSDFEFFLRRFPDGRFAPIAKLKLEQLSRASPPSEPAPAKAVPARAPRPDLVGDYAVRGRNPSGTTYRGSARVEWDGSQYRIEWRIGAQLFHGKGHLAGNTLVIDWGQPSPVIYAIRPDGTLDGKWSNGLGTDVLTPLR